MSAPHCPASFITRLLFTAALLAVAWSGPALAQPAPQGAPQQEMPTQGAAGQEAPAPAPLGQAQTGLGQSGAGQPGVIQPVQPAQPAQPDQTNGGQAGQPVVQAGQPGQPNAGQPVQPGVAQPAEPGVTPPAQTGAPQSAKPGEPQPLHPGPVQTGQTGQPGQPIQPGSPQPGALQPAQPGSIPPGQSSGNQPAAPQATPPAPGLANPAPAPMTLPGPVKPQAHKVSIAPAGSLHLPPGWMVTDPSAAGKQVASIEERLGLPPAKSSTVFSAIKSSPATGWLAEMVLERSDPSPLNNNLIPLLTPEEKTEIYDLTRLSLTGGLKMAEAAMEITETTFKTFGRYHTLIVSLRGSEGAVPVKTHVVYYFLPEQTHLLSVTYKAEAAKELNPDFTMIMDTFDPDAQYTPVAPPPRKDGEKLNDYLARIYAQQ